MNLTERQAEILEGVCQQYIRQAFPISSRFFKEKQGSLYSPATIRAEFARLEEQNYLYHPYISAGRIPTDKGFRFFVDGLFEEERSDFESKEALEYFYTIFKDIDNIDDVDNIVRLSYGLAKSLASFSSNLGIVRMGDFDLFWKEGWNEVVQAPEFQDIEYLREFVELVQDFESKINDIDFEEDKTKVYIGKESPFVGKEFSIIVSQSFALKNKEKKAIFAILGPKRMDFKKNIVLINSLIEAADNY